MVRKGNGRDEEVNKAIRAPGVLLDDRRSVSLNPEHNFTLN
ncbi:hypothetical protein Brsp04_01388 [Brucella sp. NBRC 12952]